MPRFLKVHSLHWESFCRDVSVYCLDSTKATKAVTQRLDEERKWIGCASKDCKIWTAAVNTHTIRAVNNCF